MNTFSSQKPKHKKYRITPMFCINSHPLYLLLLLLLLHTFLIISPSSSSLSHADSHHHGMIDEDEYGVVSWGMKRSLLDGESVGNSSMVLAAKRTHRRDPLDSLKHYSRGWNISHKHYLSSVSFSAAPLFIIAALWFLGFGLCLFIICIHYCCCRKRHYGYSRMAYALSLILLTFFTISAIVGCVVLYTGQGKFHSSTTHTLNYIVSQSDNTVEKLRNVSEYLDAAKGVGMDQYFLPSSVQNSIDTIEKKINASSNTLDKETEKNKSNIQDVLDVVRLALIIIAAGMLLLAFLGFLFSVLGMQVHVNILVIIGWILVAVTFILCGLFLVVHNVAGDTCVAMGEWIQHPTASTALDEILPCVDNATAQETLFQSKDVTFQLVAMVNTFITNVSNNNISIFNQSGPLVPVLCNPFHPDKTDRECAAGEVGLNNASEVWKIYVCQVSGAGICSTMGRLTPNYYNQMTAAVNVSYALHRYSPFLVGLQDCSFVRETFRVIHKDHCPGLNLYSKWIYIGLVMVSDAVMLSLIFWVLYARERRHRVYTKQLIRDASTQDLLRGDKSLK